MRILIAYATKTESSRECAEILAKHLAPRDVRTVNLAESVPNPEEYDAVVLGAPVRMGRMHKKFRDYLKKYSDSLVKGRYGFFVCCAMPEEAEKYLKKNVGERLLEGAFAAEYFGGEMKVEKQKSFFDRLFVKSVRSKAHESQDPDYNGEMIIIPELLPENISRFADKIKAIKDREG